jgi:hypothetical protein
MPFICIEKICWWLFTSICCSHLCKHDICNVFLSIIHSSDSKKKKSFSLLIENIKKKKKSYLILKAKFDRLFNSLKNGFGFHKQLLLKKNNQNVLMRGNIF